MIGDQQTVIEHCGLIYSINEDDKTASVVGHKSISNKIFIPRAVKYNSSDYLITKISESAFEESKIETVEFSSDSEIQTIEDFAFSICKNLHTIKIPSNSKIQNIGQGAFNSTSIKSFTIPYHLKVISKYLFSGCSSLQHIEIPMNCELQTIKSLAFEELSIKSLTISSKLINLEKDWSRSIFNLESIIVSPKNPRYCLFDEQILIGKSSLEEKNYDSLVLCTKNIKKITIPSFIKIIESNALSNCRQLQTIEFTKDSKLQKIDYCAFESTPIEFIKLPSQLEIIKSGAFSFCRNLKTIEFPSDSQLKTICASAFAFSSIEYFTIPSNLIFLRKGWCSHAKQLNRIDVSPNNQNFKVFDNKIIIGKLLGEIFNILYFCFRNVKNITIPDFIICIDAFSFCECKQLQKVNIPDRTFIINDYAFSECTNLCIVDITQNSELEEIGEGAFYKTPIMSFSFPSHLKYINKNAFESCEKLQIVEFIGLSEIELIDTSAFKGCDNLIITASVQIADKFKESPEDEDI